MVYTPAMMMAIPMHGATYVMYEKAVDEVEVRC